jgi:hypothetical protein
MVGRAHPRAAELGFALINRGSADPPTAASRTLSLTPRLQPGVPGPKHAPNCFNSFRYHYDSSPSVD